MMKQAWVRQSIKQNIAPIIVVSLLIAVLLLLPVQYEQKLFPNTERVKVKIVSTDESGITRAGIIQFGDQRCQVEIKQGRFKGQTANAMNHLNGSLSNDKIFQWLHDSLQHFQPKTNTHCNTEQSP